MNLRDLIEKNLWNIILTLAGGFMAYVIGTTSTAATIKDLSNRVGQLEEGSRVHAAYDECATRHFDRLESGAAGAAPCPLGR